PFAPPLQPPARAALVAGQTLVLPEEAWQGLRIAFRFAGADADLTLFLTADGAARLLGKQQEGPHTVESATLHLSALPDRVHRVAIAINMDVDTGLTC